MDDIMAIEVDRVAKKYCRSLRKSMTYGIVDVGRNLLGLSSLPHRLRPDEFFAVDDVSFALKKGETLGVIGLNGSGKSTLLKLINGIFRPDRGRITINGRVGALIEVGAGFHPALTGRENIYVNAAILGMSKREVDEKFDDIVKFADIGDFLETPVKHYSVGMHVRLGFAVAIHCDPDILLVDEVLSVGDVEFIEKCQARINEMLGRGVTLILVSHNLRLIGAMCSRAILLHHGKQVIDADVNTVLRKYEDMLNDAGKSAWPPDRSSVSRHKCVLLNSRIGDGTKEAPATVYIGDQIRYSVDYDLHPSLDLENVQVILGLLKSKEGLPVARYTSLLDGFRLSTHRGRIEFSVELDITAGNYLFEVGFVNNGVQPLASGLSPQFRVRHPTLPNVNREHYGQFLLKPKISVRPRDVDRP